MVKSIFYILLSALIISNLFSFLETPKSGIFYTFKLIFLIMTTAYLTVVFNIKKNSIILTKGNLFIIVFIWTTLLIPSVYGSGSFISGIIFIFSFLLLGYFCFIAFPNNINSMKEYFKINYVWLLTLFGGLVFAIGLSYIGYSKMYYISVDGRLRYLFSFSNSNFLGSFAYVGCIIGIKLIFLKAYNKYHKIIYLLITIFILIFMLALLILSDSRTPFYALIIYIATYILLNVKFKINPYIKVFIGCLLCCIVILIIPQIDFDFNLIDTITSNRFSFWGILVSNLNGIEWLIGKGAGLTATELIRSLNRITYDNSFLSTLMQHGILGLFGMFLLIFSSIKQIVKINNLKLKKIAIATLMSWLAFSLFESSFYSTGNLTSIYIWSELGILISSNKFFDTKV